jgi:DNA-binding transcriptional MerR regulator
VKERPIPTVTLPQADPFLSIGLFARRSRLSMKALRLYDRLGLLTPARIDQASGYRRYRESQLATARLVVMLRRLGMPLAQVTEVVSAPGPQAAALISSYWEGIERRVASQRELAAHLRIRLLGGEGRFGMFEIREREVPEQLVLTEQRHVQVTDLSGWIGAAMMRLMKTAERHGGVSRETFVIYHGDVNEDSDGPVEVCVPIALAQETSVDAAMRHEPAHREAYVRLVKAQVEFPQILSAYDAVAEWLSSHGRSAAGPPREVYFADFGAADPTDEVCDVAFPVQ